MSAKSSPVLNVSLWIAQGLMAAAFLMAGATKTLQPPDALVAAGMGFAAYTPVAVIKFIGISEVLGAIGLILPSALRIQPILTPIAAAALLVVMVLAAGMHAVNGEPGIPVNVVLGAILGFIAWGRAVGAPLSARGAAASGVAA